MFALIIVMSLEWMIFAFAFAIIDDAKYKILLAI